MQPRLAKNAAINVMTQITLGVAALILMPRLMGVYGLERFGALTLVWTTFTYLTLFNLGLARSVTRSTATARNTEGWAPRVNELIWSATSMQVAMGLIGGVLLYLGSDPMAHALIKTGPTIPEMRTALQVTALSLPVVLIASTFRGCLEGLQRFDLSSGVRVGIALMDIAWPFVIARETTNIGVVAWALLGNRIVGAAAYGFMLMRIGAFRPLHRAVQRDTLKELFVFGKWVAVTDIVGPAFNFADKYTVSGLLGPAALGLYTMPYELGVRIWIFPMGLTDALFPALTAQLSTDPERAKTLFARATKYILLGLPLICIPLGVMAHPLLLAWLKTEKAHLSAGVLQILLVGVVLNGLAMAPSVLLTAMGMPYWRVRLYLLEGAVFLSASYFFSRIWGLPGAAAAWSLRMAVVALGLFAILIRLRLLNFQFVRQISLFPIGLAHVMAYGAFTLILRGTGAHGEGQLLAGLALLAGTCLFILRGVLDAQDASMLASLSRRLFRAKRVMEA